MIVRAPVGIDDEKIRDAVADRALWVHRSLAEWEDLNASRRYRPLVQGQGFAYLGRSYRLKFVADADVPLRLKNGRWELSEAFVAREGEAATRKAFRDFYIDERLQIFTERVQSLAPRLVLSPVNSRSRSWAIIGHRAARAAH